MDMPTVTPLMIFSAFAIGSIASYLAYKRERNPYIWFVVGFLFGIFGIFAIFFAAGKKKSVPSTEKKEPVFNIDGPKDKFWYYLDNLQQRQGPVSHDALTSAWKSGEVDVSTFVWNEEMTDWKPLKETLKAEEVKI
ncbi:MAG: hypothetical protein COT85_07375 [Chlamydiae bacterium CG10_big_fil_rev_8_21_14_0_10_42_34]|nr:MAG: hypothetical protein COT85_07375 [Chlamydiae bacterium CG10_big_fil_rev_8_21_14_0_10_42_34]